LDSMDGVHVALPQRDDASPILPAAVGSGRTGVPRRGLDRLRLES
jgi:hypothetical protein